MIRSGVIFPIFYVAFFIVRIVLGGPLFAVRVYRLLTERDAVSVEAVSYPKRAVFLVGGSLVLYASATHLLDHWAEFTLPDIPIIPSALSWSNI